MKEKKMANKKYVWGMLAVILAFTMVIAGCNQDGDDDENTDPKKITITGIPSGITGEVMIGIAIETGFIAVGEATSTNNSVTVSLKSADDDGYPTDNDWTGTGSFMVFLYIGDTEYIYTNGADLNADSFADIPKYNITSAVSTIPFDKFKPVSAGEEP
jgi:hypothetical protein